MPQPTNPVPIEPDRLELFEEFAAAFRHHGLWRHVHAAWEDGRVDIGEAEYDRIKDLVIELGMDSEGWATIR